MSNGQEEVKAKEIPRAYIKNDLNYKRYLDNISSGLGILARFTKIISNKHVVTTAVISKKALSSYTKLFFGKDPRKMSLAFAHHALAPSMNSG